MLELLLPELQELIFQHIPFNLSRSINKHFKQLADKIELNNDVMFWITVKSQYQNVKCMTKRTLSYLDQQS